MNKLGAGSGEGAPVIYLIPTKLNPEIPPRSKLREAWIVLRGIALRGRDSGRAALGGWGLRGWGGGRRKELLLLRSKSAPGDKNESCSLSLGTEYRRKLTD